MGLFNTSANSSQPDWSLSAEIEIFSFVLIPKTITMQMNKINLKQTAYKFSNQLSNIIVVNICKLPFLTYQDFHVQFRLRCMMGPSSSSTPVVFPRKKKLFCSSGKTLKFNVFFLRGKTEYQALEEGRRQPRTEPRIVRYLKIIQVVIINHFRYTVLKFSMIASLRKHKL